MLATPSEADINDRVDRIPDRAPTTALLSNVSDPKIAVLTQNDDFGKDLLSGLKQGLGSKADKLVLWLPTRSQNPTVDSQTTQLKGSDANVLVNIATAKFAAQAIRKVGELGWRPAHYLSYVSASVGGVMKPAGLENAQSIITAAFIKDPTDPQWARTADFLERKTFMQSAYPAGNLTQFENAYAYAAASVLVQVLKQCGDDLTRANIMRQAASLRGSRRRCSRASRHRRPLSRRRRQSERSSTIRHWLLEFCKLCRTSGRATMLEKLRLFASWMRSP